MLLCENFLRTYCKRLHVQVVYNHIGISLVDPLLTHVHDASYTPVSIIIVNFCR